MRAEFERVGREAAKGYLDAGMAGLEDPIQRHIIRLGKILPPHVEAVMRAFGERVLDDSGVAALLKASGDDFTRRIREFVSRQTADDVVQIGNTTKFQIRSAIQRSVTDGVGQRGTAKLIRQRTGGVIGRLRSNVIARTETHRASQVAGDEAVKASGIKDRVLRRWIANRGDGRTRNTHLAVKGLKTVDEPFLVGGDLLRFPGDPRGSAREVINCRCVLGYEPIQDVPADVIPTPPTEPLPPNPPSEPPLAARIRRAQEQARDDVVRQGKATGHEHLSAVDLDTGEIIFEGTSGKVSSVGFTSKQVKIMNNPSANIDLHHNHPGASSLSPGDFQATATFRGVDRIVAHGHDGQFYAGRTKMAIAPLKKTSKEVYDAMVEEVRLVPESDIPFAVIQRHFMHSVNLGLERLGVVEYEYTLVGKRLAEWKTVEGQFEVMISKALEGIAAGG